MAYKTPGVYVEEIAKFPPSVAQVATAIPAFIGYTQKATGLQGENLSYVPTKIRGLADYELLFGGVFTPPSGYQLTLDADNLPTGHSIQKYFMYDSLRAFYDNGGGECYIVSVGGYTDEITLLNNTDPANKTGLLEGLARLKKEDEPTLILFPDAVGTVADGTVALDRPTLGSLQAATLQQCARLQDRFGIFDVAGGFNPDTLESDVQDFRDNIGIANLKYGAVYYPWLLTNYGKTIRLREITESGSGNPVVQAVGDSMLAGEAQTAYDNYTGKTGVTNAVLSAFTNGLGGSDPETGFSNRVTFNGLGGGLPVIMENIVASIRGTSDSTEATNLFRELLLLFRQGIKLVQVLRNSGTDPGTDLLAVISEAETSGDLVAEVQKFIAFEKSANLVSGLSDLGDEAAVNSAYAVLTGTPWMAGVTGDDVANLSAGTGPASADVPVAVAYLKSNINYSLILGALDNLFAAAVHNEQLAEQQLLAAAPVYANLMRYLDRETRLLPPSGFMAGIYAQADRTRGVWKAPANVGVRGVVGPAVKITNAEQDDLNVHTTGKSVNAIRTFAGKGTLVWGARTLAGNDNEWRYIPVRRFFNMVEESAKKASLQFVFEPNDANTWVKVRGMIENFLILQWRAGALQGATPEQAFYVKIGLGETMNALDILEGRMIVETGMAVVRPAEFIILKFSHKMAES